MLLLSNAHGTPPGKLLLSLSLVPSLRNVSCRAGSRSAGTPPGAGQRNAVRGPGRTRPPKLTVVVAEAPLTLAVTDCGGVTKRSLKVPAAGASAEYLAAVKVALLLIAFASATATACGSGFGPVGTA